MKYDASKVFDSELPEFAGVKYKIRKFSHGLRTKVRARLAEALERIREKTEQISEIMEEAGFNDQIEQPTGQSLQIVALDSEGNEKLPEKDRKFSTEQIRAVERVGDINRSIEVLVAAEIDPVYLEAGLMDIWGLEIEGVEGPITAKVMYDEGPEDLCREIVRRVKQMAGIAVEDKENLGLPITSGAVADGQTNDTIAPPASASTGTQPETVESISLIK